MIANWEHHGHMTWFILNIPHNLPTQDVMVASVWYIFNILNMHRFITGTVGGIVTSLNCLLVL